MVQFKRFHETKRQASSMLSQLKKDDPFKANGMTIWNISKTFPNRKRKFFIGTELEWLNI